jgi:putative DNA primase/helicase
MPFPFDPDPPQPRRWLGFLGALFGDDEESVGLLQEWFGYCLTGDTSQQKMLMVIGPTRSGKGTIGRVLEGLVGPENFAGPSLASLGTNFGLEAMLGKPVAVLGDARLSARSDQAVLLERLLSISGEDVLTVDRKHRAHWQGKLPTRVVLLANELPDQKDASMALANRLLILPLDRSFAGREDPGLTDALLAELPGIFAWAVEGLRRLRQCGRFLKARRGRETLEAVKGVSSPVSTFLEECCDTGPRLSVPCDSLYNAYRRWCQRSGKKPPAAARFGKDLQAAAGQHRRKRKHSEGQKAYVYEGVALKTEARALADAWPS